jgi:hypothetical protein
LRTGPKTPYRDSLADGVVEAILDLHAGETLERVLQEHPGLSLAQIKLARD